MKEMMSKMMQADSPNMDSDSAKMEVLEELRDLAISLMGDKMKDKGPMGNPVMKEVTVAAPDKEGLQKGLQMASEMAPEIDHSSEDSDMDLEEIEAQIRELEEMRRQKMGQA